MTDLTESTAPTPSEKATPGPAVAGADPATAGLSSEDTGVGSVFVSNYPPFSAWSEEGVARAHAVLNAPAEHPERPLGLYLHIPFCRRRCKFCYFKVYTDRNFDQIGGYIDALSREVELLAQRPAVADRDLSFVYFGGGTPSFISVDHLRQLAGSVQAVMPWDAVREITFECEPGTLTQSKLEAIRELGVTRLSLGVENFDDDILRENGRAHVTKEIWRVLPWIDELDFPQLNIDLIAGMVGETWDTWKDTVAKTVDVAPDSVTIYQMELPYNARFSAQLMDGELDVPLADWQTKRAWNLYAMEKLEEAGYERSSAYTMVKKGAAKKSESAENGGGEGDSRFLYRDALWHGADLLGTGVASFGHVQGVHMQNTSDWNSYLEALEADHLPLGRAYETSREDRLTREMILQMKLGRLEAAPFREKFGVEILDHFADAFGRLEEQGMLTVDRSGGRVVLSDKGLLRVDTLLPEFYAAEHRGARYT